MTPAEWEWMCEQAELAIERLIREHPDKAAQARDKPQRIGWFVGQAMKMMNGHRDPEVVNMIANELIFR
jgi:aspartyl-tRNA(Asn)/glutamyl-tRNA(Gln) amidotransferase subunit B